MKTLILLSCLLGMTGCCPSKPQVKIHYGEKITIIDRNDFYPPYCAYPTKRFSDTSYEFCKHKYVRPPGIDSPDKEDVYYSCNIYDLEKDNLQIAQGCNINEK